MNSQKFKKGDILAHKTQPSYKMEIVDITKKYYSYRWLSGYSDRDVHVTTSPLNSYCLITKLEKALL